MTGRRDTQLEKRDTRLRLERAREHLARCVQVKAKLARDAGTEAPQLALWQRLTAGASAGMCYWGLTYPLDTIKARQQVWPSSPAAQPEVARGCLCCGQAAAHGVGWADTARTLYLDGGLRAFWRSARSARAHLEPHRRARAACAILRPCSPGG
jgi:hypothetical protein